MKTLKFKRDFDVRVTQTLMRAFEKGKTYSGVTESDAKAALDAGAAELVTAEPEAPAAPAARDEEAATETPRRGRR